MGRPENLLNNFKSWMEYMSVADHRALPVAVSQGIWISRNSIIFEAKAYSPVELFKFHKINYVYDQVRKLPQPKPVR